MSKKNIINLALIAALTITTAIAFSSIFDMKLCQNGDNIYYFSLARSLSQGEGYTDGINIVSTPHVHFPPGYPFLMSLVMRAGFDTIRDMKILNGIFFILSVIVVFFIFLHLTKNKLLSFFVSGLVALNASLLGWATIMMSEIPYLFWTSLAILLFLKAFSFAKISEIKTVHYLYFAGAVFCMVFAYFIKTLGMALLLAMCFTLIFEIVRTCILYLKNKTLDRPSFQKRGLILGVFLLFTVLVYYVPSNMWSQRNQSVGLDRNTYIDNFLVRADGTRMATFNDWQTRVFNHSEQAIRRWIPYSVFQNRTDNPAMTPISWFWGLVILGILFWGAYKANSLILFLFVGFSIGVQLFYNEMWAGMRFMVATVPFLIFYFVYGVYTLIYQGIALLREKLFANKKVFTKNVFLDVAIVLSLVMFFAPTYSESFERRKELSRFETWNIFNASQGFVEFIEMAGWISENISQDRIISNRKPEVLFMYSNYFRSIGMPEMHASIEEILEFFDTERVNYVLLDHWFPRAYAAIAPVINRYPHKFRIVHAIGTATETTRATLLVEYLPNQE